MLSSQPEAGRDPTIRGAQVKRVRLGVIGTGLNFRYDHLPALQELEARFQIVALCNRTSAKAEVIADHLAASPHIYTDHREVLSRDDVEAVLVTVPIHLQSKIAQDAIASGKHVFQEKPIADSVAEGGRAISLAQEHRVVFMVGEDFRYRPEFRQVHRLVQDGIIGQPKLLSLNALDYTHPEDMWPQTSWRQEGKHHGGYLVDGGVHIIAGMREMVGSEVKLVHGLTASFNPELLSQQDDTLLLHLVFENGLVAQTALGYGAIDGDAHRSKMYGDRGTLVLDIGARRVIEVLPVDTAAETREIPLETAGNRFKAEWLDFYSAIIEGKPPYGTPEEALLDLIVIDAGLRSAASGKTIKL
jgi:predicted dehydrogenase